MKTKTILIGSLLLLMTLFAASLLVIQTTGTVTVDVGITPFMLTEEDGPPDLFKVKIKVPASSGKTTADIDPDTVTVEGLSMDPEPEDWDEPYKVTKNFFAFMVNGNDLFNIVMGKVGHVTPGTKVNVDVTVTGNFYEDDGFTGTCTVIMMLLRPDPTPPPG